mgnify:CR=1 FL=1
MQPDFEMMRPPGVTNHYSRIFTPNAQAVSNETFMAGTSVIGENTLDAVRSVMTCSPDYLVMGMSAVTFYGGATGADAFQAKVETRSRRQHQHRLAFLHRGAEGLWRRQADRVPVAVLSGRQRAGAALFHGFRLRGGPRHLSRMQELDGDRRSAAGRAARKADRARTATAATSTRIVQVGTNLSMVRLAAAAEMWLGKPVDRHQHRDLLARAAPEQDHGQDSRVLGDCSRSSEPGGNTVT